MWVLDVNSLGLSFHLSTCQLCDPGLVFVPQLPEGGDNSMYPKRLRGFNKKALMQCRVETCLEACLEFLGEHEAHGEMVRPPWVESEIYSLLLLDNK